MFSRSSRSSIALALLLSSTLLPAHLALALEGDRDQPIRITADQALRDEKQGFTVYQGNVHMEQGSLRIDADAITVYHRGAKTERIVGEGQPARLQQQSDPNEGPMHASANIIEYFQSEERVHLRGNATIEQQGSTVNGETIDYFIREQRVKADSDPGRRRVEVVIPAQQLQSGEDQSSEKSGDQRGETDGN